MNFRFGGDFVAYNTVRDTISTSILLPFVNPTGQLVAIKVFATPGNVLDCFVDQLVLIEVQTSAIVVKLIVKSNFGVEQGTLHQKIGLLLIVFSPYKLIIAPLHASFVKSSMREGHVRIQISILQSIWDDRNIQRSLVNVVFFVFLYFWNVRTLILILMLIQT